MPHGRSDVPFRRSAPRSHPTKLHDNSEASSASVFPGKDSPQLMHTIRLDFEEGDFRRRYSHSQVDESFSTPSRLLLFRPTYLTTTSKEYQSPISWPQERGVSDYQY